MTNVLRLLAAALAVAWTFLLLLLLFVASGGTLVVPALPAISAASLAVRLFLTRAFWELAKGITELVVAYRDTSRTVGVLLRSGRVRWPLLGRLAVQGSLALTTVVLIVTTVFTIVAGPDVA